MPSPTSREIVLDTETTGLGAAEERIVEVGAVELIDKEPTGREFHRYINPGKRNTPRAFAVHGLSDQFLSGQPYFVDIAADLIDFCDDAPLIIHNAAFDVAFLNAELERNGFDHRFILADAVDTMMLARKRWPGGKATLDAVCGKLKISRSERAKHHGALIDCRILAKVYRALSQGGQQGLNLFSAPVSSIQADEAPRIRPPFRSRLTPQEAAAHASFVATLGGKDGPPIWDDYQLAKEGEIAA